MDGVTDGQIDGQPEDSVHDLAVHWMGLHTVGQIDGQMDGQQEDSTHSQTIHRTALDKWTDDMINDDELTIPELYGRAVCWMV